MLFNRAPPPAVRPSSQTVQRPRSLATRTYLLWSGTLERDTGQVCTFAPGCTPLHLPGATKRTRNKTLI